MNGMRANISLQKYPPIDLLIARINPLYTFRRAEKLPCIFHEYLDSSIFVIHTR